MRDLDVGTRWALAAMGLGVFLIANDFTALSVALPQMERDLGTDLSTVQWVINAYSLVFGVLTVSGGRLADLLGRRRVFVTGAAIFALCSLLAALAPSAGLLIAARALMAVGGALMWPATLAMTYGLLPEARRNLAGALVLGVAGLGNACGPLLGGALTELASWRWVLAINVPIALAAIAVVTRTVPESRGEDEDRRFDLAGMAFVTGSLVALLLALDQVAVWGWGDARVLALLAAFALLMAAFVVRERTAGPVALIPRDVAGNATFRAVLLAVLLMSMTFFSAMVYVPQFMEKQLGFSALGAGVGLLPLLLLFGLVSFFSGPLYERFGGRAVLLAGAALLPVAMVLLSLPGEGAGYLALVPGMALLGLGVGLFYPSAATAAVSALAASRAGLASGLLYMLQVAGGSLGLGAATTIVSDADALVPGIQAAMRVGAVFAVAGAVVVLVAVRPRRAAPEGAAPAGAVGASAVAAAQD